MKKRFLLLCINLTCSVSNELKAVENTDFKVIASQCFLHVIVLRITLYLFHRAHSRFEP